MGLGFRSEAELNTEIKELEQLNKQIREEYENTNGINLFSYLKRSQEVIHFFNGELAEWKGKHAELEKRIREEVKNSDNYDIGGSHNGLEDKITDIQNNLQKITPKSWQNPILSIFGIISGAVVILKIIWDWKESRKLWGQLDELETKWKNNLKK